jgi:S-adenosylmethionine hydrolase
VERRRLVERMTENPVTPVISLLTDFGLIDPYVSEMKAIILSICPRAKIVDISHLVEKFNIRMGAYLLAAAATSFPTATVNVAVVDPGVGGSRRPIVMETAHSLLVGPDNGLLVPAAQAEGILHVYHVTNRSLMKSQVSATFHGRDIFAPVAAHLACGVPAKECGVEITDFLRPAYAKPKFNGKRVFCEVFHIDGFGNIITNVRAMQTPFKLKPNQKLKISLGKRQFSARHVNTYSDLKKDEYGLLAGGQGFLEIACKERSAAKRVRARTGMAVRFSSV